MKKRLQTISRGLAAAAAMSIAGLANAVPSISLTTNDPLVYQVGDTAQLTVNFSITGVTTANEVLVQLSNWVAYDPTVLQYASIINFGTALDWGTTSGNYDLVDLNYSTIGNPGISGIGTPVQETNYVDGSLFIDMSINGTPDANGLDDLLGVQSPGPALLFSIVFDVVTTQIANSTIVLINDQNLNPINPADTGFDTKLWDNGGQTPTPLVSNALQVSIQPVPVPGGIALLVLGLAGLLAHVRRRA